MAVNRWQNVVNLCQRLKFDAKLWSVDKDSTFLCKAKKLTSLTNQEFHVGNYGETPPRNFLSFSLRFPNGFF